MRGIKHTTITIGILALVAGTTLNAAAAENVGVAAGGPTVAGVDRASSGCGSLVALATSIETLTLSTETYYEDPAFGTKPRFAIEWQEPLPTVPYDEHVSSPGLQLTIECAPVPAVLVDGPSRPLPPAVATD